MLQSIGTKLKVGTAAVAATAMIATPALNSGPLTLPEPVAAPPAISTVDISPAAWENPIRVYGEVIAETAYNLGRIGEILIQEPAPILTQIARNQIANGAYLAVAGADTVAQLIPVFLEVPGALWEATGYLIRFQPVEAARTALGPVEDGARVLLAGAGDLVPIATNTAANLARAAVAAGVTLVLVTPSVIGMGLSVAWVGAVTGAQMFTALIRGDWLGLAGEVINAPAEFTGALLNGHSFQLGFSISLPILGSMGVDAELGLPGLLGGRPTGFTIDAPFLPPGGVHLEVLHGVIPVLLNQRDRIADALRPIDQSAALDNTSSSQLLAAPMPAPQTPIAAEIDRLLSTVPAAVDSALGNVERLAGDLAAGITQAPQAVQFDGGGAPAPAAVPAPAVPALPLPKLPEAAAIAEAIPAELAPHVAPAMPAVEGLLEQFAPAGR